MSCQICSHSTQEVFHHDHKSVYTYCQNCECIALKRSFYVDAFHEKKQYDNHHNSLENEGYVKMFEDFLDFFWDDLSTQTKEILDFGSGPTPVLSFLMQKRGATVACYDKFYCENKSVFQQNRYDAITSTEVFEHLDAPIETLKTLGKCLKKGGYLAIMTLFHDNHENHFWRWWYRRDPTHIVFYTPKTFEILSALCGFKLIRHDKKRIILLQKQ